MFLKLKDNCILTWIFLIIIRIWTWIFNFEWIIIIFLIFIIKFISIVRIIIIIVFNLIWIIFLLIFIVFSIFFNSSGLFLFLSVDRRLRSLLLERFLSPLLDRFRRFLNLDLERSLFVDVFYHFQHLYRVFLI